MDQSKQLLTSNNLILFLASTELLSGLDKSILHDLKKEIKLVRIRSGKTLIRQGAVGDCLYIVINGRLRASIKHESGDEEVLGEVGHGQSVGEMAILNEEPRSATVRAIYDTELVKLSKEGFNRLVEKYPQAMKQVTQTIMTRFQSSESRRFRPAATELISFLASTELFGTLDRSILRDLEADLEWVNLSSGEILIHQGDVGDCLYVVVNGRLRVVTERQSGDKEVIGEVGRGECVGEMAILTGEDRSATVFAIRDTELVKFSKVQFDQFMEKHPQAMMQIARIIIKRLRWAIRSSRVINTLTTIAVVPTGEHVPLSDFSNRLATALATAGSTLHLNSVHFDSLLGKGAAQTPQDDANNGRIVRWLNDQETKYRFIVYESDSTWSPWTSRCIRQADCILIVGLAKSNPELGEIETKILNATSSKVTARKELVLLYQGGNQQPLGTQKWLAIRHLDTHHHIRLDIKTDFERLARLLTGRGVGLVLGGGGARGFAHIGVIQALEEAKIPVDIVGGASMGSIIAAAYAMGWNHEVMLGKIRSILKDPGALFDLTIPIVSLLSGQKFVKILTSLFGDTQIEDLWLKYFCVSTNLSRAKMMVHQEGPLWRSVRASGALPGIIPPVFYQGDLLVDGAVLNNLPVDIMSALCNGGPVIAVDVSFHVDLAANSQYGDSLSGWKVLWNLMNPWTKLNIPNITSILMRTTELSSVHVQETLIMTGKADLYLRPPVDQFGILEFKSAEKIVEIGYQFAKEKIKAWKDRNAKTSVKN